MPNRLKNSRIRHSIKIETTTGDDEPTDENLNNKILIAGSELEVVEDENTSIAARRLRSLELYDDFESPINKGRKYLGFIRF